MAPRFAAVSQSGIISHLLTLICLNKKAMANNDATNPAHYKNKKIEHWDVVEDWRLDYLLGNCTKYISRYRDKGNPLQDLEKAAVYLNRKIELMKKQLAEQEANQLPTPEELPF